MYIIQTSIAGPPNIGLPLLLSAAPPLRFQYACHPCRRRGGLRRNHRHLGGEPRHRQHSDSPTADRASTDSNKDHCGRDAGASQAVCGISGATGFHAPADERSDVAEG